MMLVMLAREASIIKITSIAEVPLPLTIPYCHSPLPDHSYFLLLF